MKINNEELSGNVKIIFVAMMQVALRMKLLGLGKNKFISFAEETWNTMELNDADDLKNLLNRMMEEDLEKFQNK